MYTLFSPRLPTSSRSPFSLPSLPPLSPSPFSLPFLPPLSPSPFSLPSPLFYFFLGLSHECEFTASSSSCSFLSSLLTAVLSHHLAWVFTVSRSSGETGRLIKSSSSKSVSGQYTVWPRFLAPPRYLLLVKLKSSLVPIRLKNAHSDFSSAWEQR